MELSGRICFRCQKKNAWSTSPCWRVVISRFGHCACILRASPTSCKLLKHCCTERGPDIVRMPYIGQKRTISGMCPISEGLDIPIVVMLFICYVMIWSCKYYYYTITINSINTAPHNDIYIHLSDIAHVLGFWAKTHYIGSTHYFERTISGTVPVYYFFSIISIIISS